MDAESAINDYLESAPRHARIVGPPGSGKTTLLVERWRALTAHGHRPGIVAFGREQRERLLERVLPPGGAHLGAYPVTTHALVAAAVLDDARPSRPRTLRDVDELVVLARLLRREPALLASDLGAIANSATFRRDMLDAIHALAQHGITSVDARLCARSANGRVRDVLSVYARHREVCEERGLVTFYDAAWRAAERYDAGGIESPLAAFDVILIDDFQDLDPGQYHLLTRLLPPDGVTALEVFGDSTGPRFSFRGTSDDFFVERFPREYAPRTRTLAAPSCTNSALDGAVSRLIAETASSPKARDSAATLPLFADVTAEDARAARPAWECSASLLLADDEIAEAQAVASRARTAIDAGTAPGNIAVIARDAEGYRAAVEMACYEWGVPLDAGGPECGAAEDFLRSLLGALGSDPDGRFAEALAISPFNDGHAEESTLRALKRDYSSRDGFDLERLLRERVTPRMAPDDDASRETLVSVVEEWRRYNEVVSHAGGGASLDEFRAAYLGERTQRMRRGNRVRLLSAREATGHAFDTVFICGCAEGYFPGTMVQDGYIPVAALARVIEREHPAAAREIAARLDEGRVERVENALFLTALTRASRALTVTVPLRIGGESVLPARVLVAGANPFVGEPTARSVSPCARAADALARAREDDALAERLRAIDATTAWWATPPAPERYPALASFRMSASKLNSYARCPRQFFYRNVLRLDEPESIYLRVGSMVHEALRQIIPPGATGDEVRAALRHAGTREIAERLVSAEMSDAGEWMRELSVRYLADMLESVARLEEEREGNYRVRLQEEDVEGEIEGMPIRGRFDRIDDVEGLGPVVIDYKTSGSIKRTYPTLIEKMETEYWQIPVYAAMTALVDIAAAGFVYYALPPGEESFAAGVQLAPGNRPAPIPLGSRRPYRYGPVVTEDVADAVARAVEIFRSIVAGECRYERTDNTGICPNCHFARICQRSRASI